MLGVSRALSDKNSYRKMILSLQADIDISVSGDKFPNPDISLARVSFFMTKGGIPE